MATIACSMPASVYSRVARKRKFSTLSLRSAIENGSFSTAERSERVEIFLFRATREYTEAGIEQATDALAPTVQNRASARRLDCHA